MAKSSLGRVMGRRGLVLVLLAAVCPSSAAHAQQTADQVCREIARKAERTLWDSVRETGDQLFCRKPWVERRPEELLACQSTATTVKFGNTVKDKWNRFFDLAGGDWATWGARGVSEEWEEGTIRGGFRRTFFGPALAASRSTVRVVKEGGRAQALITVCELDQAGAVVCARRQTFDSGPGGVDSAQTFRYDNPDTRILGVVVDTPVSVNNFEYRVRVSNEPIRNDLPAVRGIADLHVHQIVDRAFAGRMYWGLHAGPKATALAPEVVTGTLAVTQGLTAEQVIESVTQPGIDANVLFWASQGGKRNDEGFYQLGGGGHPGYRQWPHHADRSHQQVHISWLEEAHRRGRPEGSNLALMVVSVVNNDILCSALKHVDSRGNVPVRDSGGAIAGWESASWGCTDHENVLRQLEAIHRLEREHSWYRVAMNPWHARQIIADGDLAVVVSLETDKPLSSESGRYGDWLDQLDRYRALGLSTLQIVHESNSIFCGAAPHRDMMTYLQLINWRLPSLANLLRSRSTFNLDANRHNALGLTREGEKLVDALVERNIPIDIAHGSERCRLAVMARVPEVYGLYDSHTKFERLLEPAPGGTDFGTCVREREQEFVILESILPKYVEHQVLVGLRTASVDVYDAPGARVANDCPGSAKSFAQLVQYAFDSGLDFAYGTDFNTGVSQLGPRFGSGRCWADLVFSSEKCSGRRRPVGEEGPAPTRLVRPIDGTNYVQDGLANIGWLPELTDDLIALGTPGATRLRQSAEAYLEMWERAYAPRRPAAPIPPMPVPPGGTRRPPVAPGTLATGLPCTADLQCESGRCSSLHGLRGVCVCNQDSDCGTGQFCNKGVDIQVNSCQPKLAAGEVCGRAGEVGVGHRCQSGRCRVSGLGGKLRCQ